MVDLLQEIETEIAGAKAAGARQSVGVIREIGDGVARVEGLADVMLNEMLDFGKGITGLALNLDETEVGVIVLGDYTQLQEGDDPGRDRGPEGEDPVEQDRREDPVHAEEREGAEHPRVHPADPAG